MQNSGTVDAISLSHSFDSLSMDEDFMNFLLDGSAAPQLPASMKTEDNQDLHLVPTTMVSDQFAFNGNNDMEGETTQDQAAERPSLPPQPSYTTTTTAISSAATQLPTTLSLPPPPPTPPSDGLSLSSPGLDDPFAGLTDIFPILGDLAEPVIEKEEEEIESGSVQTTSSSSSAAAVPLVKVKEEPKEPKRKSSSSKEKKAARAAKKQKLEPQPSDFIESLRGMNSAQLEQYAETQPLTEAQQTELKEWIRKIKNRESASLSRQNRKNHQQELEIQIEGLDTSNSRLREQITELQIENRVLKKELDDFKTLIEKSNLGQAFALYNNTKKAAAPPAPVAAPVETTTAAVTPAVPPPSASVAAPAPTPAVVPSGGIQLSDVILKAMSGGKPNKEGMALVLYLLMALHSYGQYWNKVTAQHQVAMPQPDEVTAQA
jgi:hypothetical protein